MRPKVTPASYRCGRRHAGDVSPGANTPSSCTDALDGLLTPPCSVFPGQVCRMPADRFDASRECAYGWHHAPCTKHNCITGGCRGSSSPPPNEACSRPGRGLGPASSSISEGRSLHHRQSSRREGTTGSLARPNRKSVSGGELDRSPAPTRRWSRGLPGSLVTSARTPFASTTGRDAARVEQPWMPVQAEQYFSVDDPGFV